MKDQLQCGYVLEGVYDVLIRKYSKKKIHNLLKGLSKYDITIQNTSPVKEVIDEFDPICGVYENIISRGLPTLSSIFVEKSLSQKYEKTHEYVEGDELYHKNEYRKTFAKATLSDDEITQLYEALHPLQRHSSKNLLNDTYEQKLGTSPDGSIQLEKEFLYRSLPKFIGEAWSHLFELQVPIESILRYASDDLERINKKKQGLPEEFSEQTVDFAFQFPYEIEGKKGIIIEIDGSQHSSDAVQAMHDDVRDKATTPAGWHTIRIDASNISNEEFYRKQFEIYQKHDYFENICNSFQQKETYSISKLILEPLAIARIQKVVLYALKHQLITLEQDVWNIAILETDTNIGKLAFEDLENSLKKLLILEGKGRKLPIINVKTITIDSNIGDDLTMDLCIDISMSQYLGRSENTCFRNNKNIITVRNAAVTKNVRTFYTDAVIRYDSLLKSYDKDKDEEVFKKHHETAIVNLLQDLFRLKEFRPGQLRIIDKALSGSSVVGLLPTGSGKSLTYQICSLLQPGVTLVIDPIKSLMKDQFDGLKSKFIDGVTYINSSIRSVEDRNYRINTISKGEVLFAFISPERLLIKEFRESLQDMSLTHKTWFSYCVVDESHCVSEWGHDFRTSYLRMAANAKAHCKVKDDALSIPFFALTATASYDVLADIKRELDLTDESVVRNKNHTRREINYLVHRSITDIDPFENISEWQFKVKVGEGKHEVLQNILEETPYSLQKIQRSIENTSLTDISESEKQRLLLPHYDPDTFYEKNTENKYETGTLIFCPHKSKKIWSGVNAVDILVSEASNSKFDTTTFYGTDNPEESEQAEKNQSKYLDNGSNLMIATKAFGMGIDKSNVRSTVHINFPSSYESLVQEAGRAGRDRHISVSHIIISDHIDIDEAINKNFLENSFKGEKKEKAIIWELLNSYTFDSNVVNDEYWDGIKTDLNLDEKVTMNLWPKTNPTRIYLNVGFDKSYGHLSIPKLGGSLGKDFDRKSSLEVIKWTLNYIQKNKPTTQNCEKWLQGGIVTFQGFEKILLQLKVGNIKKNIPLGFTNTAFEQIYELIKPLWKNVSKNIVASLLQYNKDVNQFLKAVANKSGAPIEVFTNAQLDIKIQPLIDTIRDEQDTFKAIYRLSILGIIEDYTVDYSKKVLHVDIKRLSDVTIKENLYKYLIKYESKQSTYKMLDTIPTRRGKTYLQKCLGFLMSFIYKTIRERRLRSIEDVKSLCVKASEMGDNGGAYMAQEIDLYFNAKYIVELRKDTYESNSYSRNTVEKYMDLVGSSIDNLNHLRGSTIRLLNERTTNPVLLLLNAYSILCLEIKTTTNTSNAITIGSSSLIKAAILDIAKACVALSIESENSNEHVLILDMLTCNLRAFNEQLEEVLIKATPNIHAMVQLAWLQSTNKKLMNL